MIFTYLIYILQIPIEKGHISGVVYIDVYQIDKEGNKKWKVHEISAKLDKRFILYPGGSATLPIECELAEELTILNPKNWNIWSNKILRIVRSWKTLLGENRDPHGCLDKGNYLIFISLFNIYIYYVA